MSDCCQACKWWFKQNSVIGQCLKTAPVASDKRLSMIGIRSASIDLGSGHIFTKRDHMCGEFERNNGEG